MSIGYSVARHTRAWIETYVKRVTCRQSLVARHTRAWIETVICLRTGQQSLRRPPYAGVD